jgi:hypothetical protein
VNKEHQAKVMLFVIGMMSDLKDEGLLGGGFELSDEGLQRYRELRDSGFNPTDEEISAMTTFIFNAAGTEEASAASEGRP